MIHLHLVVRAGAGIAPIDFSQELFQAGPITIRLAEVDLTFADERIDGSLEQRIGIACKGDANRFRRFLRLLEPGGFVPIVKAHVRIIVSRKSRPDPGRPQIGIARDDCLKGLIGPTPQFLRSLVGSHFEQCFGENRGR